eukprot:TRINITY_DN11386_c0_g1_i1.p1 TRINITY_DN11386_c0_g1~~TRINITY_DN11386_c0_g1_i1.p1  ORF type:complete len:347 (+),score=70.89 TRINITY_DN11386_c0_g1_i1:58-1098(+)
MSQLKKPFLEALNEEGIICAEGYLFELERRGYVQAGSFVPIPVIEHPEVVEQLHREFVRAGSNVVEAFTYYAHRERLAVVGKEHLLEKMNRDALQIAKKVADETGTYFAGNVCNTNVYDPNDSKTHDLVRSMFQEQIGWAKEAGVDFIIAETIDYCGEAIIAVEEIKKSGLIAVVTLGPHIDDLTFDKIPTIEACILLEKAGADVVGLNCHKGPTTILPLIQQLVQKLTVPVAALPVPFRTTCEHPVMNSLKDPVTGERAFPVNLDPFLCSRSDITQFTTEAKKMGVKYFGLCCGCGPHQVRAMAEALGRKPESSKYSADMTRHFSMGNGSHVKQHNKENCLAQNQ